MTRPSPVRLESWVETREQVRVLVIDHYPRCHKCKQVILGSAARPWQQKCSHCGTVNLSTVMAGPIS